MAEGHSRIAIALAEQIADQFPSVTYIATDEFARVIDERLADTRAHYAPLQFARCAFVTHHPAGPCAECLAAAMRDFILLPEQLATPTSAFVCVSYEPGWGPCGFCGKPGNKLCDFPTGNGDKTCDAQICKDCATSVEPNRDYCPIHKTKGK